VGKEIQVYSLWQDRPLLHIKKQRSGWKYTNSAGGSAIYFNREQIRSELPFPSRKMWAQGATQLSKKNPPAQTQKNEHAKKGQKGEIWPSFAMRVGHDQNAISGNREAQNTPSRPTPAANPNQGTAKKAMKPQTQQSKDAHVAPNANIKSPKVKRMRGKKKRGHHFERDTCQPLLKRRWLWVRQRPNSPLSGEARLKEPAKKRRQTVQNGRPRSGTASAPPRTC